MARKLIDDSDRTSEDYRRLTEAEKFILGYEAFYAKRQGLGDVSAMSEEERDALSQRAQAYLLDDLYKNLDTLDQKIQVLLMFSGLIVAAAAILATRASGVEYDSVLIVIVGTALLAALFGFSVIDVRWTSARRMRNRSLEEACVTYYKTRQHRTRMYSVARWMMIASTAMFGSYFLVDALLT